MAYCTKTRWLTLKTLQIILSFSNHVSKSSPNHFESSPLSLAGMLTPDLLIEKDQINRHLNIFQSSFFGPEEQAELMQPTSEFLYAIHVLVFNKFQISDHMLRDLFLNRLIVGPEILHPAKRTLLKVMLDNLGHLKQ